MCAREQELERFPGDVVVEFPTDFPEGFAPHFPYRKLPLIMFTKRSRLFIIGRSTVVVGYRARYKYTFSRSYVLFTLQTREYPL